MLRLVRVLRGLVRLLMLLLLLLLLLYRVECAHTRQRHGRRPCRRTCSIRLGRLPALGPSIVRIQGGRGIGWARIRYGLSRGPRLVMVGIGHGFRRR